MHSTGQDRVQAVIARYSEDVAWAADLKFPYVLYNKGSDEIPGAIKLDNTGREAHTYFTHIIRNYDHLADYTVFLQGNPFPHMEDKADVHRLNALVLEAVAKKRPFTPLAWFRLVCDRQGRPHDLNDPGKRGRWPGFGKDIPVGEIFVALFHQPAPEKFIASAPTGLFIVSKDRILARPPAFYQAALNLIQSDPDDANNTGHAFERLWNLVFNGNPRLSAYYDE